MKIHVKDIKEDGYTINQYCTSNWLKGYFTTHDEIKKSIVNDIKLEIFLEKEDENVHVAGKATTKLLVLCDKCLSEFESDTELVLDINLVPERLRSKNNKEKSELDVGYYKNDGIDMLELIGNEFSLSMPMNFICKNNCKGLCQYCGKNKNTNVCDCENAEKEPKFNALRQIKIN
jgi:uncharacterized protein